jgi:Tfp pilus assembly protein FimT
MRRNPLAHSHPRKACRTAYGRRSAGLSLIEMTIVLFTLGVISAVGALRYAETLQDHRAQRAAQRIAADIESARHTARSRNQAITISFDVPNHSYSITGLTNPDRQSAPFSVVINDEVLSARLISASFGGDAALQFSGFGMPDSGGVLTLQAGSTVKTVTVVAGTGAVTVP